MKLCLLVAALLFVPATASAQLESERTLISKEQSHPVPGVPLDGLWVYQVFGGLTSDYNTTLRYYRIQWSAEEHVYKNLFAGHDVRVLPLSESSFLLEKDNPVTGGGDLRLAHWSDGTLQFYLPRIKPSAPSPFLKHLLSKGITIHNGAMRGDRDLILEALRSWDFSRKNPYARIRRPSEEEMAHVWSYFELQLWGGQQMNTLAQVDMAINKLRSLGDLHMTHNVVSHANYPKLADMKPGAVEGFHIGSIDTSDLQSIVLRAGQYQTRVEKKIARRMKELASQIELVGSKAVEGKNPSDYSPSPGARLAVHLLAKHSNGSVFIDTRKQGTPWNVEIMGNLPEGMQYALCTMHFDEVATFRIPANLAFGAKQGDVEVELEIVESMPGGLSYPPLESSFIYGYKLGKLDFVEAPSGLRYREITPGQGPSPKRGDTVEIHMGSWSPGAQVVEAMGAKTITVGDDKNMPGVNEALLSMKVGNRRVLYLSPRLADQSREHAGLAQAVLLELRSIKE